VAFFVGNLEHQSPEAIATSSTSPDISLAEFQKQESERGKEEIELTMAKTQLNLSKPGRAVNVGVILMGGYTIPSLHLTTNVS